MNKLTLTLMLACSCSSQPQGCTSTISHPNTGVWCSYSFPLFGQDIPSVAAPDAVKSADNGGGSPGVYAACFSPTTQEHVFDGRMIPTNIGLSPSARLTFAWYQGDAGSGNVVWCQEFTLLYAGDSAATTTFVDCDTVAASGVSGQIQIKSFDTIPFSLSSRAVVSNLTFYRKAADAADTLGVDACVKGRALYYQCDRSALSELP